MLLVSGYSTAQSPEETGGIAPTDIGASNQVIAAPACMYKKKVAATRFLVANSLQLADITDIWDGYPLELLRRLESSDCFVVSNTTVSLLLGSGNPNPDSFANRALIRRFAEQTGSQFIISGAILDAGVSSRMILPYAGWQGVETGPRAEIGLPWNSVVVGVRPTPSSRRFEVEFFIHDGLTGTLIARQRNSADASGRVTVGRNTPFASAAFFDTSYGEVVDQTLAVQTKSIAKLLASQTFSANVVRVDGRKLLINAGSTSALRVGDKFTVFHRNDTIPAENPTTDEILGIPERPAATMTLLQVQEQIAVGELENEAGLARVEAGDHVHPYGRRGKQIRE